MRQNGWIHTHYTFDFFCFHRNTINLSLPEKNMVNTNKIIILKFKSVLTKKKSNQICRCNYYQLLSFIAVILKVCHWHWLASVSFFVRFCLCVITVMRIICSIIVLGMYVVLFFLNYCRKEQIRLYQLFHRKALIFKSGQN